MTERQEIKKIRMSYLTGIGSCLGIAGGHYPVDEEAASKLVEEAWASVGDSLRRVMEGVGSPERRSTQGANHCTTSLSIFKKDD